MTEREEANAHWAAASFQRLLELGSSDLGARDQLLNSGIVKSRVDALYPLPTFAELLPSVLEHLIANIGGWNATLVNSSDPLSFIGHKLEFEQGLKDQYLAQSTELFNLPEFGWPLTHQMLKAVANFHDGYLRHLHSLLWHAWWAMSHRDRIGDQGRGYADELMLATIEYLLPSLKASSQPRFQGFHSIAAEELY